MKLYGKQLLFLLVCIVSMKVQAQHNQLVIPDTMTGPVYDLNMVDTFKQIFPGQQTITSAFNGNWWGPTLIFHQGDTVQMNVHNMLNDTSTVHWHGFHLPAVMDGGPHQVIPPGTIWRPYWKVTNPAATYWYHPHLHMMTEKQLTHGLGGFIIVRDSLESSLALPRTYGVDDIPLAITDRKFTANNQLVDSAAHYGDTLLLNGVPNAEYTLPAQWVRLRVLDVAQERAYNIGLSDNSTFYVIGNDGSLLDTPVGMTRLLMSVGERYEILVNLTGRQGQTLNLMAYNSSISQDVNGSEPSSTPAPFGNRLGRRDFDILHINIGAQTSNAITALPLTLLPYTTIDTLLATQCRRKLLGDDPASGVLTAKSWIDKDYFKFNRIDDYLHVDSTEIWTIIDSSIGSHAFHIHDIEFKIVDIDGVPPPAHERGWKDVVYVRHYSKVRFITTFSTYYDTIWPFMYHCHILFHEDEGMMRQFVVVPSSFQIPVITTYVQALPAASVNAIKAYPNPASSRLIVETDDPSMQLYYVRILDNEGRTLFMLLEPQYKNDIDISLLSPGVYFVNIIDISKRTITKKFIKE